jgi:hypothetical protein
MKHASSRNRFLPKLLETNKNMSWKQQWKQAFFFAINDCTALIYSGILDGQVCLQITSQVEGVCLIINICMNEIS